MSRGSRGANGFGAFDIVSSRLWSTTDHGASRPDSRRGDVDPRLARMVRGTRSVEWRTAFSRHAGGRTRESSRPRSTSAATIKSSCLRQRRGSSVRHQHPAWRPRPCLGRWRQTSAAFSMSTVQRSERWPTRSSTRRTIGQGSCHSGESKAPACGPRPTILRDPRGSKVLCHWLCRSSNVPPRHCATFWRGGR